MMLLYLKKALVKRYFPGKYTKEQLDKLDDNGFAITGQTLLMETPYMLFWKSANLLLKIGFYQTLHKSLVNPYKMLQKIWNHQEPGTVVDAHTQGKSIRILLRSIKPLRLAINLPDCMETRELYPLFCPTTQCHTIEKLGKPVDILLNPASVTSRINLGQIMETAAAKIAQKTGKPYLVKNFR
jgi:hypothetical protein